MSDVLSVPETVSDFYPAGLVGFQILSPGSGFFKFRVLFPESQLSRKTGTSDPGDPCPGQGWKM